MEESEDLHIAIIPDGNRRWAKKHNKSIREAYEIGIKKFLDVGKWGEEFNIKTLSAWGFSTENFKRSEEEKKVLWELFDRFLAEMIEKYEKEERAKNLKINFLGRLYLFPKNIEEKMLKLMEVTKNNKPYTLNFLMAYGGRAEIVDGINKLLKEGRASITEEEFSSYLYTRGQKDPDLIIRTGGEKRLSGLFPWQSIYSELIFLEKYWPDFGEEDFKYAISEFRRRKRRFGK